MLFVRLIFFFSGDIKIEGQKALGGKWSAAVYRGQVACFSQSVFRSPESDHAEVQDLEESGNFSSKVCQQLNISPKESRCGGGGAWDLA